MFRPYAMQADSDYRRSRKSTGNFVSEKFGFVSPFLRFLVLTGMPRYFSGINQYGD
jgi:hypothetical protein